MASVVGLRGAPSSNPELWPGALALAFSCMWPRTLSGSRCLASGFIFLAGIPDPCCLNALIPVLAAFPRHMSLVRFHCISSSLTWLLACPRSLLLLVIGPLSLILGFLALKACQTPSLEFLLVSYANPSRWSMCKASFFTDSLGFKKIIIKNSHYEKSLWDNEN